MKIEAKNFTLWVRVISIVCKTRLKMVVEVKRDYRMRLRWYKWYVWTDKT